MPLPVLLRVARNIPVLDTFSRVGVCFIKLVDYDSYISAANTPLAMHRLFLQLKETLHALDEIVAKHDVFKVEPVVVRHMFLLRRDAPLMLTHVCSRRSTGTSYRIT